MLTDQEIEAITEFGGCMMNEREVSIITGISADNPQFQEYFWKAWYTTEAQINQKIKDLAIANSSSAQTLAYQIIKSKT